MLRERHDWQTKGSPWLRPAERSGGAVEDERDIDDPATSFGEVLSCLRLATGMSQNALGQEASVNASYVNRLERGERTTPTREVVVALARALGATPQEHDHLLMTAGYVPPSLQQLGPADTTLAAVGRLLTNDRLSPASLDAFRAVVETMAACWGSGVDVGLTCAPAVLKSLAVSRTAMQAGDPCYRTRAERHQMGRRRTATRPGDGGEPGKRHIGSLKQ